MKIIILTKSVIFLTNNSYSILEVCKNKKIMI